MKNLFKVVTVFATLALLVGTMVALSVSAAGGDQGATDATATGAAATETAAETTGSETETLAGDANVDGFVNMKDILTIRKYIVGTDVTIDLDGADAFDDDVVDMKDVLVLRQFIADIIDELPTTVEPTNA